VEAGLNLVESFKEGYGSKSAVLPVMMMMVMVMVMVMVMILWVAK
jgi:hypothetical protein